ncbi:hypothetical protein AB0M46_04320 [Dactylosporangium sp. NPDC051485]|uniref:hypothetical protein n=1 Tax=Dactylosporangium sp. NPDC051485 TaxID=3154846 RepID=UPI003434317E
MDEGILESLRLVEAVHARVYESLRTAQRTAAAEEIRRVSRDGRVAVSVGGDLRVREVALGNGVAGHYTEQELADEVKRLYRDCLAAANELQVRQLRRAIA